MAKKQKTTASEHENAYTENIQKRLETLLPQKADIPASISIQQAEALEARVRELEAQLEQRPGMADQQAPAVVQKTDPQSFSITREQSERVSQTPPSTTNIAVLVALLLSIGHFLAGLYYLHLGWSSEISQFYAVVTVSFSLGILFGLSSILCRRKQQSFGIVLVQGAVAVAYPPLAISVMEVGLALGLVLILASLMISLQALPRRIAWALALLTFLSGLVTVLLDRSHFMALPATPEVFIALVAIPILGYFLVQQFRRYPMRARLVTSFLLLTIAPLSILGWQTYSTTHDILENQIKSEILRSSVSTGVEFQEFLDSQLNTIRSQVRATEIIEYMSLPQSQRNGSEQESLVYDKLKAFSKNKPSYIKSYALLDMNGTDVLDTNKSRIGTSFAEQDFFTTVTTNKQPYVSGLSISTKGSNNVYFAAPITDKSGKLLGVYVVTYNPEVVQSIITQMVRANQLAAPSTEFTYLIDGDNYFILAHSMRVDQLYKTYLDMDDPRLAKLQEQNGINQDKLSKFVVPQPAIVTALSELETTTDFQAPALDGELTESAAVRLANSNWIVVTSRPTSTISNIIANQTRANVTTSTIIIIFVALFALLLSSFFTSPIIQLTRVAESISTGNLTQKAQIHRNDEIGVLARTFNGMTDQMQALISGLEQRVEDRTHDLELASEVGRTIAEKVENVSVMLTEATEMIRSRFNLYYTQVYLLDPSGQTITLRAGTGDVGKQLLQRRHSLPVNPNSLNGRAVFERKPVIVADTEKSGAFLPNPLLPKTRSEMAVPLLVGDKVLGVLDMQSESPNALNEDNLVAFQVLAGQLSVAIQNATLFTQSEESRKQLEANVRQITEAGWHDFLNAIERGEKIGYTFNQIEVMPMKNVNGMNPTNALQVPVLVTGANVGTIQLFGEERIWTAQETEIAQAVAEQLGQHIDNLRLLAQAESYRSEAEQAVRRLTREGWDYFLENRNLSNTYVYDLNEVKPFSGNGHDPSPSGQTVTQAIIVREETIGELAIDETHNLEEAHEILSGVAQQLSAHIENLRLLEQTQQRSFELEEAQSFLDSVVEHLPTMLFVKEAEDLSFVRWNKAAENLTGHRREGLLGKNDYDFFQKEQADFFTSIDREVLTSGQLLDIPEEELATVHQGTRYLHTRKVPIWGPDGKPKYLLGIAEDITERKKAEEILRVSESRLSEALNIAKLGNWEYDFERDRFIFNDHFYSIFHTTVEQVGGYELSAAEYTKLFVHPDDAALVGEAIGKAIASTDRHYSTKLEHRILFADGGFGYIAVDVHIERDENGKITRWYGANQDITERKKAEEVIAKRATELATVAQVSTTASTVLDPDQLLQSVVDLTKEQFRLYHAHIYLADDAWNTLLLAAGAGEVGRQLVAQGWNIAMDHEQSIVARAARSKQPVIANDLVRDANSSFLSNQLLPDTRSEMAVPMIVGDKVLGVFDVQADVANHFSAEDANIFITLASQVAVVLQNSRLYKEQSATLTQLRELDKLKSSFLANMSHELRTPLNSILGFTDVILEGLDGPLTDHMDNDLRLVQKNGQHLLHLINDVLDMAKIEAGRMNLHPETFKVHEVLDEVTSIASPLASEKNLSLFIEDRSNRDTEIYADRTRLRQVMINLVNNSIKFTETGKISLSVSPVDQTRVLITVKDSGIGIPPEKLESVFLEFTQVDSSTTRKSGGTGLGLPISRRLVEMHGGRLWAESTGIPGDGSTFFVELPFEARIAEVLEKQEK